MKIWCVIKTREEGCAYYRIWLPHKDFATIFEGDVPDLDCDILVFNHKSWNMDLMKEAKQKGIKLVVDFDDWVEVPESHIFYKSYNLNTSLMFEQLKLADLVTCTTDILRNELLPYNKNVEVIPNALNPDELPHTIKPTDRHMTFGYTGGMCHLPDVKELTGVTRRLQQDPTTLNRWYIALMGYWDINYQTDAVRKQYLDILSYNRKYQNRMRLYPKVKATDYLRLYDFFDVSLIPLREGRFNYCKSPVKIVESGFYEKSVICSDVEPYKRLLTEGNSLRVTHGDWYQQMKWAIRNPEGMKDKAMSLSEMVKKDYDLRKWNEIRKEIYKSLI
jgi:hypothetical protein